MRASNASVRLEAHRLKWVRNEKKGPLLSFHELTELEKQFLVEELGKNATIRRLNLEIIDDEEKYNSLFLDVLNDWGIMCPHPVAFIERTDISCRCNMCDCDIIPVLRNIFKQAQ